MMAMRTMRPREIALASHRFLPSPLAGEGQGERGWVKQRASEIPLSPALSRKGRGGKSAAYWHGI